MQPRHIADAQDKAQVVPAVSSGYLNEVSTLNVPSKPGVPDAPTVRVAAEPGDHREH